MAVKVTVYGTADMRQIDQARTSLDLLEQKARASAGGVGGAMSNLGKGADAAAKSLKGVGDSATKNLTVPLLAAGVGAYKLAESASDLAESQSKVQTVFGTSAAALDVWASKADQTMGQTKQEALDNASNFAIFGKAAGLTGDQLVTFSEGLTSTAADMASFSNTSPADAATALGAALRGESEPIRAYGVLLDDATLKAEAMRMGLLKGVTDADKITAAQLRQELALKAYNAAVANSGKDSDQAKKAQIALTSAQSGLEQATTGTIGTLTAQQRVLAANSAVAKQLGKDGSGALGDFSRTIDGTANQQRIMTAELKNTGTELGAAFLPFLREGVSLIRTDLIPGLKGAAGAFAGMDDGQKRAVLGLAVFLAGIGPVSLAVGKLLGGVVGLGRGFVTFGGLAIKGVGGLTNFATGLTNASAGVSAFATPMMRLGGLVRTGALAVADLAVTVAKGGVAMVVSAGQWVASTAAMVAHRVAALATSAASAAVAAGQWLVNAAVAGGTWVAQTAAMIAYKAVQVAGAVASGVMTAAQWALNVALSANPIALVVIAIAALVAGLVWAYQNCEQFRNVVNAVWAAVSGAVQVAFAAITGAVQTGVAAVTGFAATVATGIAQVQAFFAALPGQVGGALAGLASLLAGIGSSALASMGGAVDAGIGGVLGFVSSIPDRIMSALAGLADIGANAGRALMDSMASAISGAVNGVTSSVQGALDRVASFFPHSPAEEGPFSGDGYSDHSGMALMTDMGAGVTARGHVVTDAAAGVMDNVRRIVTQPQTAALDIEAKVMQFPSQPRAQFATHQQYTSSRTISIAPGAVVVHAEGADDPEAVGDSVREAFRKLVSSLEAA